MSNRLQLSSPGDLIGVIKKMFKILGGLSWASEASVSYLKYIITYVTDWIDQSSLLYFIYLLLQVQFDLWKVDS